MRQNGRDYCMWGSVTGIVNIEMFYCRATARCSPIGRGSELLLPGADGCPHLLHVAVTIVDLADGGERAATYVVKKLLDNDLRHASSRQAGN